jgi:hypothetical protein
MAPRANWKGFLRLSLVTCPIALFPATSESEKISFDQINKQTGNRIRYLKVDADTGDEVASEDIIKGYKVDTDRYLEVTKDELENIALESTRTIEIDEFVPRSEIDDLYLVRPYYIVPDGKVGHDAYAVIRETTMLGAIDWGFRVILVTDALCSSADETHDAMMNIYMNRFGKQVETVTTQTLLDSDPEECGSGKRHERGALAPRADSPAEEDRQRTAHPQRVV